MNIKEILLSGGTVEFPYKEKKNEWVDKVSIFIYSGQLSFKKPSIVMTGIYLERDEFGIEDLDEAIEKFEHHVFNKKNLMWKMNEVLVELSSNNDFVDLDRDEDLKRVIKLQKIKQKEYGKY